MYLYCALCLYDNTSYVVAENNPFQQYRPEYFGFAQVGGSLPINPKRINNNGA